MRIILTALLMACFMLPVQASEVTNVVLQLSEDTPKKQTVLLNVANNLIKEYGIDNINIRIVVFGPGAKLALAKNKNASRVQSLVQHGVRFNLCSNTHKKILKKASGAKFNEHFTIERPGVVHIIEMVKDNYILITP